MSATTLLAAFLLLGAALALAPAAAAEGCIAEIHGLCVNDPRCPGPACPGRVALSGPRGVAAPLLA